MKIVNCTINSSIEKHMKKYTILEKKKIKRKVENIIYSIDHNKPVDFTCNLHIGMYSTTIAWNNEMGELYAVFELDRSFQNCKITYPTEDFNKKVYDKVKIIQSLYFDS